MGFKYHSYVFLQYLLQVLVCDFQWLFMKVFTVYLRHCAFGLLTYVVKTVFMFLRLSIFSSLAVFSFDRCPVRITCIAQLCSFVSGQEITHCCMNIELRQLLLYCWAAFKCNILCTRFYNEMIFWEQPISNDW